jgi:hypothetical protein
MLAQALTLSVSIQRDPEAVYRFASEPMNFPKWVTSFVQSAENRAGKWFLITSLGEQQIVFVEKNALGVLDHYVILPNGTKVYAPMRVIANGSGSTVLFTLFRLPEMSDADFERDSGMIRRDLDTLKKVLESDS